MRKVVAYELLSLDGVAESPEEFIVDFDDVMEENLAEVIDQFRSEIRHHIDAPSGVVVQRERR